MKNKKLSIKEISFEESRKTNGGIPAVFVGGVNPGFAKVAIVIIGAFSLGFAKIAYTWD